MKTRLWAEPEDLHSPTPFDTIAETYNGGKTPGLKDRQLFQKGLEIALDEDRLRDWLAGPTEAELEDEQHWREDQEAALAEEDPDFVMGGDAAVDEIAVLGKGKKRKKGADGEKAKRARSHESARRATRKQREAFDPRADDILVIDNSVILLIF